MLCNDKARAATQKLERKILALILIEIDSIKNRDEMIDEKPCSGRLGTRSFDSDLSADADADHTVPLQMSSQSRRSVHFPTVVCGCIRRTHMSVENERRQGELTRSIIYGLFKRNWILRFCSRSEMKWRKVK